MIGKIAGIDFVGQRGGLLGDGRSSPPERFARQQDLQIVRDVAPIEEHDVAHRLTQYAASFANGVLEGERPQLRRTCTGGSGEKSTVTLAGPVNHTGGVTLPSITTWPAFRPPNAAATGEPASHARQFIG
jgi:hypothetical protein